VGVVEGEGVVVRLEQLVPLDQQGPPDSLAQVQQAQLAPLVLQDRLDLRVRLKQEQLDLQGQLD
jgi:hypothetical protein